MKKVIILATAAFITSATAASGTTRQDIKEPFYVIDFSVVRCKFEIQINNVEVLTMNVNGQMASNIQCNHLILESGVQQLDIIVYPRAGDSGFDAESAFSFKLMLYDSDNEFKLIEDNIVGWKMSDNDKTQDVCRHTVSFRAQVPYQIDAWQNSADLNTVENLRQKVETAYQKLGEMISQKQYDAFKSMMQVREKRIAASLYLDEADMRKRTDELIEDLNDFELVPLSGAETMHIYADGRLVCLKNEDGESALRLRNIKETDEEMYIEVFFHLKKGNTELTVSP
jgi:hypothetical protein